MAFERPEPPWAEDAEEAPLLCGCLRLSFAVMEMLMSASLLKSVSELTRRADLRDSIRRISSSRLEMTASSPMSTLTQSCTDNVLGLSMSSREM